MSAADEPERTAATATRIGRVSAMPGVLAAAQEGAKLVALWPLTKASELGNDAKYAENLQVRQTRAIAAALTGERVTIADAEYVYEGAESIPGRPQGIVDALLAANAACDAMADYSQTQDPRLLAQAGTELGLTWDDTTLAPCRQALAAIEAGHGGESSLDRRIARSLAAVIVAADGILRAVATPAIADIIAVVLAADELCETLSIPRLFLAEDALQSVRTIYAGDAIAGDTAATLPALAGILAPAARKEWTKHTEDVLWDPEEAKRQAKADDERRNREALAAKFSKPAQ
ncbi:hypothetical protein [Bifidobacterium thermophilum]|uniref:hypothetical protein n=1 Tax=Bifidobacterium thermophilum TaxID=33905 RepID=UPI0030991736